MCAKTMAVRTHYIRGIRTPTDRHLRPVPLPLGYWHKFASRVGFEPTPTAFVALSPSTGREKLVAGVRLALTSFGL